MKLIKGITVLLATLTFSSLANAVPIVDIVSQDVYLGPLGGTHYYEHDVSAALSGLEAISGTIDIELYDTCSSRLDCFFERYTLELALVVVDGLNFDTGGVSVFNIDFTNAIGASALATINSVGVLGIQITAILDDFWVGDSTLTLEAIRAVPEPGIVTLLGLGLLGAGITSRRRKLKVSRI